MKIAIKPILVCIDALINDVCDMRFNARPLLKSMVRLSEIFLSIVSNDNNRKISSKLKTFYKILR